MPPGFDPVGWLFGLLRDAVTGRTLEQAGVDGPMVTVGVELGSGYAAPEPPPGLNESRDLAHCEPELRRRYELLKADYRAETGRELFETCTWRSKERQHELYQQGRTVPGKIVTNCDGVHKKSRHNVYPSQAIDVCVDVDPGPGKQAAWGPALYEALGPLALRHGLRWGGDWNRNGQTTDERFVDYPHLELPAEAV